MLGPMVDVFRLRQYFNIITRTRELVGGVREDAGLINDARRAVVTLPFERRRRPDPHPFPRAQALGVADLQRRRLALLATGGSGALASVVGAAKALEEAGIRPAVISLCSGSALFGFPIAAGIAADEVAAFTLGLRPDDYVDVDWPMLASVVPRAAKGFAGVIRGERIEATYRRLLGDMTLAEMPIPAYAPIWNIEDNRLEYIGPRTYPDLPVARAIHMAVALPLFIEPVMLNGGYWCDGGIVDIFPVRPVLDIEEPPEVVLAINGFYPRGIRRRGRVGLAGPPRQHPLHRQPGPYLPARGAGEDQSDSARAGDRRDDDRACALREGPRGRLLPAVPQHHRMAGLHACRPPRGPSRPRGAITPIRIAPESVCYSGVWQTASTLLPSGSRTKAA